MMLTLILIVLLALGVSWIIGEIAKFEMLIEKGLPQQDTLKHRYIASRIRLNECRAKRCHEDLEHKIKLTPYSEIEEKQLDLEEETEEDTAFGMPIDMLEEDEEES